MLELLPVPSSPMKALFPPEHGRLSIVGKTFRDENGIIWQWRGISAFLLFLRYARGEDIVPDLHWYRVHGFNMLRIFGPLPWKETPDYRVENFPFDKLPAFFQLLQDYGLRCNWSIAHYEHPDLKAHVKRWYAIANDFWAPVAEVVNEPHVGSEKPDPISLIKGVDRGHVLTAYGLYSKYYDKKEGLDPVLDFQTLHITRDSAWHRKARHAQELQEEIGKPCISDEPAKLTEPGFHYVGGKNDDRLMVNGSLNPNYTPAEATWHHAICALWTPGSTVHPEEGKWGRVPVEGMLQYECIKTIRDNVFLKINATWQNGKYRGAHFPDSPVDGKDLKINGEDIWTYSSLHEKRALSVRCALSEPNATLGWSKIGKWGPANSIVELVAWH